MRRAALQCWQLATRFDHEASIKVLPLYDMRRDAA
jgi:hypothetical protein